MASVEKGKKIIVGVVVSLLLIDFITTAATSSLYATNGMMEQASYKLLQGMFRFILTGVILFFLYKGHKWAKLLITILLLAGGLAVLLSLSNSFNLITLAMGAIYFFISFILLTSNSVNKFMKAQRGEIVTEDTSDGSFKEW
jgi:uncharacterized membrane protein YfhO